MTKLIIAVVGGTLLISSIFIFGMSSGGSSSGKIEINPTEYDFGDISMAAGPVTKTYEIKNNSDSDLKIDKIWTSCDCTNAILKVGDRTSPKLGMHTNLPLWSETLTPSQTGYLDVTFDPAFHGPSGTGPITRVTYLLTSDPENKQVELLLTANVKP